jgi:hypothetical protein
VSDRDIFAIVRNFSLKLNGTSRRRKYFFILETPQIRGVTPILGIFRFFLFHPHTSAVNFSLHAVVAILDHTLPNSLSALWRHGCRHNKLTSRSDMEALRASGIALGVAAMQSSPAFIALEESHVQQVESSCGQNAGLGNDRIFSALMMPFICVGYYCVMTLLRFGSRDR